MIFVILNWTVSHLEFGFNNFGKDYHEDKGQSMSLKNPILNSWSYSSSFLFVHVELTLSVLPCAPCEFVFWRIFTTPFVVILLIWSFYSTFLFLTKFLSFSVLCVLLPIQKLYTFSLSGCSSAAYVIIVLYRKFCFSFFSQYFYLSL